MALPTSDEKDELLLSCRYGDLEDIHQFVQQFGQDAVAELRDENGNTALHMAAGNGHEDVLDYLLPITPPSLLSTQNNSGSTPLHWAALNSHLLTVQKLVQFPGGPGVDLIDMKNAAGRSPLAEAEMTGWDQGAKWLVEMMKLDLEQGGATEGGAGEGIGGSITEEDIQVEIEDADGQVAKMTIGGNTAVSGGPRSSSATTDS
ncbi:ankyrin [Macrolepiota fuliginosa MF-IS2]|uniref:Ankyrin n=1 Tax=Macrolepiota fuliginosa MF-IS2 TaxID=1400762 RepID=A0A9P6C031_9AGAR|nr:ankyrin [Macrolepiota fuliginosa MF-IS2]